MANCAVCSAPVALLQEGRVESLNCPRCGLYKVVVFDKPAIEAWTEYLRENPKKLANVSGWIRDHQGEVITPERLRQLEELQTPSYGERKTKFLVFIKKQSTILGQRIALTPDFMQHLIAACWCFNSNEISFLITSLETDAFIEHKASGLRLTAKGYDYLARLDVNPTSQTGFCAMWFDASVASLWEKAVEPAVGNAGYQPLRIDKKEHVNRIDDEIFADIRRSRFVIADFTHGEKGVRGGVYFEAGFAQGLGLPVIWTCREDMLSEDKLHFDIRQYNFLAWTDASLDDFKDRLQKRIEAILGRGTWKPE